MAKVLNTHEQADFERLAAFYPYRDEHGLPVLEESLKDYAKRTNQAVNTVKRQAAVIALTRWEPRIALDAIDVVWKAGGRAGVTLSGTVMQTMQNVELTITLRE
ncbi:hypothetical protein AB9G86_04905 [Escherichia coli]